MAAPAARADETVGYADDSGSINLNQKWRLPPQELTKPSATPTIPSESI
jgi:hypothetical protein